MFEIRVLTEDGILVSQESILDEHAAWDKFDTVREVVEAGEIVQLIDLETDWVRGEAHGGWR